MNIEAIVEFSPAFIAGIWVTLRIVCISLFFGAILSVPIALIQVYKIRYLKGFVDAYSYAMRGTPLLVQIYILYYGLSQFEAVRDSWTWVILRDAELCLLFGFSLNLAAYLAEILRGALMAVPKGEIESGRAYGMSEVQLIRYIMLPNAIRRSIPTLSNQVIFLVHSSVLASTITITDILGVGRELNLTYYLVVEGFLMAAIIYLALNLMLTFGFRMLELRFAKFLR